MSLNRDSQRITRVDPDKRFCRRLDSILPVDIYVPGCPPRPDAVIDGIMKLQKKIELERPIKKLLSDRSADDEWLEGSGQELRQPNAAIRSAERSADRDDRGKAR